MALEDKLWEVARLMRVLGLERIYVDGRIVGREHVRRLLLRLSVPAAEKDEHRVRKRP